MHSGWSLDIKKMSWVEKTSEETDFIVEALKLTGKERILDLACGYGRHSLELARRGYEVVGADFTESYIEDARASAAKEGLSAKFVVADVREIHFESEFDAVLSMADGAIGYMESDSENLRVFDAIGKALRPGGRHVMGICSAEHARKHFPKRHWEAGASSLSLADFVWNEATRRMLYRGHVLNFGEELKKFPNQFPSISKEDHWTRLYSLEELTAILRARGMRVDAAYGAYDTKTPASPDSLMQVVCSTKTGKR